MDHSAAEHKTRPPLSFTQVASLPRNSKTSSIKRISSAWKPQGTPTQKNAPRHSLDITPTKTVVPPALVTDVPLLKRTSTTDLSQLHRQASTSSVSLSSLHKVNVRPNRTGSNGSLDPKVSKVRVRDRSKELDLAKIEEPASLSRSKKLMSMKEKNERILANINATISPPTSPAKSYRVPSSEPPLPPPPPSSDSSSASSSTSSDTDADSLAFKTVLSPAAPPHPTPHSEQVHHSDSDSLRIPNQSGLIPFAQGLSPSPRKISSSNISNFKPDGKSPKMEEDGRDEDLRLGSVRGKRADQRRSIIGFGLDEDEEADGKDDELAKVAKTSAGKQGKQEESDRTLTYKAEDTEKELQGSMRRITACKDARASNQLSSGSNQDAHESSHGETEARSTDSQLLSSSGLRDRDGQSEQADIPDRIRHPSESRSLTSSSETIGKGMTTGSQGSFTPPSRHHSYCHSEYEFQAAEDEDEGWNVGRRLKPSEAEEDDMLTPVKKARRPGMLRHSSSVDDVAGHHHHHHHDERPRSVLAPASSTFSRGSAPNGRTFVHQLSSSHDLRASQSVLRGLLPSPSRPAHAQGTRPGRASSLAFEPDYRHPPDFHSTSISSHHRLLHQPTDEWDARDARQNSIFPTTTANTTTQHQQGLPAMNGSPPPSHLNYSRRSRPGLPQHFIQPSRTSESSTPYRSPILSGSSNARTPDRSLRTSPVRSQTLAHAQPSPSRYGRGSDSIGRGIESAMSFYDPAVGQSSGALSAFRSKHSSLTTTDDYSAFERSHSVSGGVYDPRNLTTGRLGHSRRTGSDEEGPQSLTTSQRHSVVGSGSDSRWTRNASGQFRRTATINWYAEQ
ncbi:hypothetical protein CROQUDRAFT_352082 [Cronartium quercuum f. sp. fusiforme G11]|uniref:Uncharacterized protein n=1 Tax=Cronartium quercuum f. sp. fusiforme G11 TaxID=708437 RepID=A0A9P6NLC6_9BASI|nr:hypothetical protein CROQUDRAFT_352082 [Cronartium quercuum f. sp. fusiforme G11]